LNGEGEESNHEDDEAGNAGHDDRVALVTVIPDLSRAADDGAAIYKTKCAARHAADAAGKPAAGIPGLTDDGLLG